MENKRKRELEECVLRILHHGDMNKMTESKVRKLAAEETGLDLKDPVNVKIVKRTVEEFFLKNPDEGVSDDKKAPAKVVSTKPPAKQQPAALPSRKKTRTFIDLDEDEEEEKAKAGMQRETIARSQVKRGEDDDNSEEFVESDEEERKGSKKTSTRRKANDVDDSIVCQLSTTRSVAVQDFKGKTLVSIREYYEKDGKRLPTQKGISLTLEQWEAFKEGIPNIEAAILRLQG